MWMHERGRSKDRSHKMASNDRGTKYFFALNRAGVSSKYSLVSIVHVHNLESGSMFSLSKHVPKKSKWSMWPVEQSSLPLLVNQDLARLGNASSGHAGWQLRARRDVIRVSALRWHTNKWFNLIYVLNMDWIGLDRAVQIALPYPCSKDVRNSKTRDSYINRHTYRTKKMKV